jgi:hypothetical protein
MVLAWVGFARTLSFERWSRSIGRLSSLCGLIVPGEPVQEAEGHESDQHEDVHMGKGLSLARMACLLAVPTIRKQGLPRTK